MIFGVDVHAQYQAGLDIPRLRAEGYSFLVTKASEGRSIPNTSTLSAAQFKARYLSWLEQTRAQGMVPGLYHWIRAGNGAEQARFFYGLVREAGGPAGMLIQLDCEHDASYADVVAWRDEWNQLTNNHPFLLYTGGWWWRPRGWDGQAITPLLWESHYLTADADTIPDDPAQFAARIPASWWAPGYGGWDGASIVQFTSRGDAGSLGNNVDLNAFRGSLDELRRLTGDDMSAERTSYNADWYFYRGVMNLDDTVDGIRIDDNDPSKTTSVPNAFAQTLKRIDVNTATPRTVTLSDEDRRAIAALVAAETEAAAERAMRRVLGAVDGATPQG